MKQLYKTLKMVAILIAILVGMLLLFYFFAPLYRFSTPQPFSGNKLYNPYKNIRPEAWRLMDVSNTDKTADDILPKDKSCFIFADNQKISPSEVSGALLPAYTHGFNLAGVKQVCIGSDEVLWIDLIFFQTTGLKQWVIDRLRPHNKLIALCTNGYSFDDLRRITQYDLLEISDGKDFSLAKWDTALSAGQKAFLLADNRAGVKKNLSFTMVNLPSKTGKSFIHSLKKGISYGVKLPVRNSVNVEAIDNILNHLPVIQKVDLLHDTLLVKLNADVKMIRFVKQGGVEAKNVKATDSALYVIKPSDQYVRIEVSLNDGTVYYLNPVIRYNGNRPQSRLIAKVDVSTTGWLRLLYFSMVAFLFWYFTRKLPGKKEK